MPKKEKTVIKNEISEQEKVFSTEIQEAPVAFEEGVKGGAELSIVPSKKRSIVSRIFARRRKLESAEKNNWKAWLYLAPTIILMAVFTFYPLINTIVIAFLKNYSYTLGTSEGFTIDNFLTVLALAGKDNMGSVVYRWQTFLKNGAYYYKNAQGIDVLVSFETDVIQYALPNTLIIVFVTVPLSIIIALLIAICLNSIKPFKKLFQTIFFVPYVTNAIAVGMVFAVLFDSKGILNFLTGQTGFHWIDVGASTSSAMFALCVYIIWHALPYKILIFLSGLQNIDKQYYDAAKIDCAGRFKTMMNVTVPLLSPQILYIMITSFIGSFKEYTSVKGLIGNSSTYATSGGKNNMYTIVYYIYDQIGTSGNIGYGAAAAVLLFIVIMAFTAIQFKVSKKRVHY